MGIISISMEKAMEDELEKAKKVLGVKSRSKIIRLAIGALLKESSSLEELKGQQSAVFTVVYPHDKKPAEMEEMLHEYSSLLKLHAHSHSLKGCAEVLVVEGDAKTIRHIFQELRKMRGVKSVNCAVT